MDQQTIDIQNCWRYCAQQFNELAAGASPTPPKRILRILRALTDRNFFERRNPDD